MSSFLNGVSAGEAKSLKPIRCVIDSFLKAGLPDGLIVACVLPSLLHIKAQCVPGAGNDPREYRIQKPP